MKSLKKPVILLILIITTFALYFYIQSTHKESKPVHVSSINKSDAHSLASKPRIQPSIKKPTIQAKAAVVMDAQSGEILYSKNENTPLAPASMSKMMTGYIVLNQIENGSLAWNDEVIVSSYAANIGGAAVQLQVGDHITVQDLFHAMFIASANNASVALAEHISGSEEDFTQLMNEQAQQLKLSPRTYFVNATGLDNEYGEESKMTALDVALLAQQLLNRYPELVEITKLSFYQMEGDGSVLYPTNKMLDPQHFELYIEGMDGLKTGFTDLAGYCFAGTAKQGDNRLISVVMGTEFEATRFEETKKLLMYGFDRLHLPLS
ncbi:D-alanyl-D-alanine carboxypeptidase [Paenibacillus sp. SC116]|uniref:D-alanyl-D-alanine carboxypeptidase family protein n=1 Tax=Paenibacillus sp. SC116 TaxID=2968986 RepID=UPI00215AEBC8|nr:D-alanyl-D-alanine carboxypeptidase family protein [Paenibacillus sp. SC116]MCR8845159.1 D-alanyl-D-alanine carboxypeptidase [Paenibacillus sp. SC116]